MSTNLVGYKLKNTQTQEVINQWGGIWGQSPGLPDMIMVPDPDTPDSKLHVLSPQINVDYFGYELVEWYMDPPPPVIPIISDRQFFQQAAILNIITQAEALAAVQVGTIPSNLQTIVDGISDPTQKFAAQMILSGATTFDRNHPLTTEVGNALGWTSEQIDQFFLDASTL